MRRPLFLVITIATSLVLAGCGDGGSTSSSDDGRPTVAVTTSILGDVVANIVGDLGDVEVIMPAGTSPHEFQPSPREAEAMREADALVVNGADLEEGLVATIAAATSDGVPTIEAIDAVDTLSYDDEEDDHGDGHDHHGTDPHFFTDPVRMAVAADYLADHLADEVPALDRDQLAQQAGRYADTLLALDDEVAELLEVVPAERRKLVTNHDVFGYFADRYGFEVIGAVIPGGTTQAEASAGELEALAKLVREHDVSTVFVETSASRRVAETLASEVGSHVDVVTLFTESLGDKGSGADTYADMVRTNAERIADALDA